MVDIDKTLDATALEASAKELAAAHSQSLSVAPAPQATVTPNPGHNLDDGGGGHDYDPNTAEVGTTTKDAASEEDNSDCSDPDGMCDPIVIDLKGDGIELVELPDSTAFFDINGDGYRNNVGWVAASDALLAYDKNEDGIICEADEISFVSYIENAQTDLQGLAAFDTNANGELDEGDDDFDRFRVWQDMDLDGESDVGELKTLAEAGITSISLTSDEIVREDGSNTIYGIGEYTMMGKYGDEQGVTGTFADASFASSNFGFQKLLDGTKIIRGSDGEKTYVNADDSNLVIDLTDSIYEGYIAGAGNDYLSAGNHKGVLLSGETGNDTITGGIGNDWLAGGKGIDSISGGAGHYISFFDNLDTVDGGDGFDIGIITPAVAMSMDLNAHHLEAIIENAANDSFNTSGKSSVFMDGGKGDDTLIGGDGGSEGVSDF